MEILAIGILIFFTIAGLIAAFFTSLGTLMVLLGAFLFSWMTSFDLLGFRWLLIMGVLYLLGEAADLALTYWGAKKFGASRKAAIGALIGGMLGAFLGPAAFGAGIVMGTFIGIFAGAVLVELAGQKSIGDSLKAGAGGVLGRIGSIAAKVLIAVAMIAVMIAGLAAGQ